MCVLVRLAFCFFILRRILRFGSTIGFRLFPPLAATKVGAVISFNLNNSSSKAFASRNLSEVNSDIVSIHFALKSFVTPCLNTSPLNGCSPSYPESSGILDFVNSAMYFLSLSAERGLIEVTDRGALARFG